LLIKQQNSAGPDLNAIQFITLEFSRPFGAPLIPIWLATVIHAGKAGVSGKLKLSTE
jgi:hypothetical protein